MKFCRAQTPQNLALTTILHKFRKTSTPQKILSELKNTNFHRQPYQNFTELSVVPTVEERNLMLKIVLVLWDFCPFKEANCGY